MVVHNGRPGADGFLDCKLKAVLLGGLYWANRKLIYYGARELFGRQEHAIVNAARASCDQNWPKNLYQRWLVMLFAKVIASLSAIDNAYAQFFQDFIVEYNKRRRTP